MDADQVNPIQPMSGVADTWLGTAGTTLLIPMLKTAEVLAALFAFPAYWAVMAWVPTTKLLLVKLAWNEPFNALLPSDVVPS